MRTVANLVLRITKPPQPVCITLDEYFVDEFARPITAVTVTSKTDHGRPREQCEAADESVSTAVAVGVAVAVAAVVVVVAARSGGGAGGSAGPSAAPKAPEGGGGGGGTGA